MKTDRTIRLAVENIPIYFALMSMSMISVIILKSIDDIKSGYELLFLLPLSYIVLLIFGSKAWDRIPENIGITLLFFLEFIRLVIAPLMFVVGGYPERITMNLEDNTRLAILIMAYETVAITIAICWPNNVKISQYADVQDEKCSQKMTFLMKIIALAILILTFLAPEIISNYRGILGVFTEQDYTTMEQAKVIDSYATSHASKLFYVLANYLMIIVRLLIPCYIMISTHIRKSNHKRIISFALIIAEFFFVDGAIARTLFYAFFLLVLYFNLNNIPLKKIYMPMLLVLIAVIMYFSARFAFKTNTNPAKYTGLILNTYFSGFNITSGIFNLPHDLQTRIYYCKRDFLGSIPFSTTIFKYNDLSIGQLFNGVNRSGGMIPTTVSMCSYYFSPIVAPLYSVVLVRASVSFGEKSLRVLNPYYKIVYYFCSFLFALGIVMYDINISLGWIVQTAVPIYIILRIAYPLENKSGREKNEKNNI